MAKIRPIFVSFARTKVQKSVCSVKSEIKFPHRVDMQHFKKLKQVLYTNFETLKIMIVFFLLLLVFREEMSIFVTR